MGEQFILKVSWIVEPKKDYDKRNAQIRSQFFGPWSTKEIKEKMEFYRNKARYGGRKKVFVIIPYQDVRTIQVDENGVMSDE